MTSLLYAGKNVLVLQGHVREVLGIDFAPNGYHVATGSDDHTVCLYYFAIMTSLIPLL